MLKNKPRVEMIASSSWAFLYDNIVKHKQDFVLVEYASDYVMGEK